MKTARILCQELGYARWPNFDNLIKRAIHLIQNSLAKGTVCATTTPVNIGSGAIRWVKDYTLDVYAVDLVETLARSYKLHGNYFIRNETSLLILIGKYCEKHNIEFRFQHQLGSFVYDCLVGNRCLIEFDEPHHSNKRQVLNDTEKSSYAEAHDYALIRLTLDDDIVDAIVAIQQVTALTRVS